METWHGWGVGWTHPFFLQNLIPRLQLCCSDPLWLFGAREGGGGGEWVQPVLERKRKHGQSIDSGVGVAR